MEEAGLFGPSALSVMEAVVARRRRASSCRDAHGSTAGSLIFSVLLLVDAFSGTGAFLEVGLLEVLSAMLVGEAHSMGPGMSGVFRIRWFSASMLASL